MSEKKKKKDYSMHTRHLFYVEENISCLATKNQSFSVDLWGDILSSPKLSTILPPNQSMKTMIVHFAEGYKKEKRMEGRFCPFNILSYGQKSAERIILNWLSRYIGQ